MKRTKKVLSLLVSILMVFSLFGALSLSAGAEDCEHLYGTTGDARFTCVKCGAVDEDLYDAVYCKQNGDLTTVWSEDFESDPIENGWTFVDMDDDGFNWEWWTSQMNFHSGSGLIASRSYEQDAGALTPDNWAVSPAVEVPEGAVLSFWVAGQDPSWAEEHYQVYVGEGGALADLEPVTDELVSTDEYQNIRVDLAEWAGKSVHIGFRHFNVSDMFMLNIDDVEIGVVAAAGDPVEHVFDDNYTCVNCGYVNETLKNAATCGSAEYDFYEDFETDPAARGWEYNDADGDGNTWYWLDASQGDFVTHSGGGILTSASYAGTALTPDNYAYSPEFTISDGAHLSVWYVGQDPSYAEENIEIILMVGEDDIHLSGKLTSGAVYQEFTSDLSAYAGQTAAIAIRHYDTYDMFRVNIDDVSVGRSTRHDFEATWDWAEDYSTCVATLTCATCGQTHTFAADVAFDEDANTYTASIIYDGETYSDTQNLPTECEHVYDDQGWEPYDENSHVRYCTICGEGAQYEEHDVIVRGAGGATCTLDGYTGDEYCSVCGAQLSEGEIIPATGHDYGEPEYEWTAVEGGWECTAKKVCRNDPEHVIGETVKATVSEEKPATCEEDGYIVYLAAFNNKSFYAQEKTVVLSATGHAYGEPEWTWNEDHTAATATFTCANDPEHIVVVEGESSAETTPPTATEEGQIVYTVTVTGPDGKAYTGTYTETIAPTGEGEEPGEEGAGPCPYCGETHDNGTISGWWTELVHHILFIIQRIFFWWA